MAGDEDGALVALTGNHAVDATRRMLGDAINNANWEGLRTGCAVASLTFHNLANK